MTDTMTSNLDQMAQDFLAVSDTYTGTLTETHPYPMYAELRSKCPVMQGDILAQYKVPSQADYGRSGRPAIGFDVIAQGHKAIGGDHLSGGCGNHGGLALYWALGQGRDALAAAWRFLAPAL